MMDYGSFIGIPIAVPGARHRHALVGFHKEPNAFGDAFQARARLCAERVGRAVERAQMKTVAEEQSRFEATGMVLESLAHEIKNDVYTIALRSCQLGVDVPPPPDAPQFMDVGSEDVRQIWADLSAASISAFEKTRLLAGRAARKGYVKVHECLHRAATRCEAVAGETIRNSRESIQFILPPAQATEDWQVWGAPAALNIVFFNLYLNAAQQIDMLARSGIRGRQDLANVRASRRRGREGTGHYTHSRHRSRNSPRGLGPDLRTGILDQGRRYGTRLVHLPQPRKSDWEGRQAR